MYRIFIVEDDPGLAEGIAQMVRAWGMDARIAGDFRRVAQEFAEYQPHLAVLDISLPFFNGYYWCQEIRKFSKVPLLFLSSAADNMNIVMAMEMGGDDFIAKPFDLEVLSAKIRALLRRTYDFGGAAPVLECRGAVLDTGDNTLRYNGERLELTRNEYRVLQVLLEHKGATVSRETLMRKLWETDSFVDENTLTVNIARLRRKLEGMGLTDFIRTKKGMGYLVE